MHPTRVEARAADPILPQSATFSAIPAARIGHRRAKAGSMDRRLLFVARNALEAKGYRWVGPGENPELIVAVDWRAPLHGEDVDPPFRREWPGRVTALPGDIGAIEVEDGWGVWTGRPPRRAPLDDAATGQRTWAVQVAVFGSAKGALMWEARGFGTSEQPSAAAIALPRVLEETVAYIPRAVRPAHRLRPGEGRLGVRLTMATRDGWRFFPRVEALAPGLPAEQELEIGTRIVAVESTLTANLALSELYDLLRGPPNSTVRLRVRDAAGNERTVYLPRAGQ